MFDSIRPQLQAEIQEIRGAGLYKEERVIYYVARC